MYTSIYKCIKVNSLFREPSFVRSTKEKTRIFVSYKPEDLVRLALKRLDVSYLTVSSHVWYMVRRKDFRVSSNVKRSRIDL